MIYIHAQWYIHVYTRTINIIKFCLYLDAKNFYTRVCVPEYPSQYTNNHSFPLSLSRTSSSINHPLSHFVFVRAPILSWNIHARFRFQVCEITRDFSMARYTRWARADCIRVQPARMRLITLRVWSKKKTDEKGGALNERVASKITEFAPRVARRRLLQREKIARAHVCFVSTPPPRTQGASNFISFIPLFCSCMRHCK